METLSLILAICLIPQFVIIALLQKIIKILGARDE